MQDLPHKKSPIQQPPAGSLAARLAQARAAQERRDTHARQAAPARWGAQDDDVASPAADAASLTDSGQGEGHAGDASVRLLIPTFKRRGRGGRVSGESVRPPKGSGHAPDDEAAPAAVGDSVAAGTPGDNVEQARPRPTSSSINISRAAAPLTQAMAELAATSATSAPSEAAVSAAADVTLSPPTAGALAGERSTDQEGSRSRTLGTGGGDARLPEPLRAPVVLATAPRVESPDGAAKPLAAARKTIDEIDEIDEIEDIEELRARARRAREEARAARRRGEREREDYTRFARGDTLKNIIPMLDDLERALAHAPASLHGDPWVAGIAMIGESVGAMLRREGVERINPLGEPFDPHLHEAVACVENDAADGFDGFDGFEDDDEDNGPREHRVARVYQPGYILNGRVLRPARVQVVTES